MLYKLDDKLPGCRLSQEEWEELREMTIPYEGHLKEMDLAPVKQRFSEMREKYGSGENEHAGCAEPLLCLCVGWACAGRVTATSLSTGKGCDVVAEFKATNIPILFVLCAGNAPPLRSECAEGAIISGRKTG